jgi:hypothetical protein
VLLPGLGFYVAPPQAKDYVAQADVCDWYIGPTNTKTLADLMRFGADEWSAEERTLKG